MAPSTNNWKFGRAYKAMIPFGYSKEIVRPVLKNLLDVYDNDWRVIEEENYSALVDALLESEANKNEDKKQISEPGDGAEEHERQLKRSKLASGSSHSPPAHIEPDSKVSDATARSQHTQKDEEHPNMSCKSQGNGELEEPQILSQQRMCEGRAKNPNCPEPSSVKEKLVCIDLSSDDENDQTGVMSVQRSPGSSSVMIKRESLSLGTSSAMEKRSELSKSVFSGSEIKNPRTSKTSASSHSRFFRAYKAMKAFGYTTPTVKPILKKLLNMYEKNWDLIEDENYSALIEALIHSKEHQKDDKKKISWVETETEENECSRKRTRSTSKTLHSSPACIEQKEGKKQVSWVEDETKENECSLKRTRSTSKALHSSPACVEQKEDKQLTPWFDDEPEEEEETPLKRKRSTSKSRHSSAGHIEPVSKPETTALYLFRGNDQPPLQQGLPQERTCEARAKKSISPEPTSSTMEKEFIESLFEDYPNDSLPIQSSLISIGETSSPFVTTTKRSLTFENDTDMPLLEGPNVVCSSDVYCSTNALEKFSSAAMIPVTEPLCNDQPGECLSSETPNAVEKCSASSELILFGAEEKDDSLNAIGGEGKQNGSSESSYLDIASSLNGEVKLSLIYKSSSQPDFCAPNLDTLVQMANEECFKSFGIMQPGFSFSKLMENVCERFVAAAAVPNDKTISLTPQSTAILPVIGFTDHQPEFCIAPEHFDGSIIFQNLVKVQPQIPIVPRSNLLETICILREMNSKRIVDAKRSLDAEVLEPLKPFYYVEDIARGEEELKISLVNEFTDDCPPAFFYIPRNIVSRDANLLFPLAHISDDNCCSDCVGDCLSRERPCACSGKTSSEFAYTAECLLKENFLENSVSMSREPQNHDIFYCRDCPLKRSKDERLHAKCKGHLVRNFVKECWIRCGCSKKCGNRVVQRGIAVNLQVFMTPDGRGWGLRTLEDLPRGAFVCEYVGVLVTKNELLEQNTHGENKKFTYPVLLDADWKSKGVLNDDEVLYLDATRYGNVARFINHRCFDANLVQVPVEIDTPDHCYYHLALFTTRNINAFEELTWDYGFDFKDQTHPVKPFKCLCGSKLCRDVQPKKRGRSTDLDDVRE